MFKDNYKKALDKLHPAKQVKENIEKLHLIEGQVNDIKYNPGMDSYLKYHNEVIYVGSAR